VSAAFNQPAGYHSYLLRFWEERGDSPAVVVWRFSLEDPLTGRRHGFATLDALTAWLRAELADSTGRARAAESDRPE
jgi:hypothetical protein